MTHNPHALMFFCVFSTPIEKCLHTQKMKKLFSSSCQTWNRTHRSGMASLGRHFSFPAPSHVSVVNSDIYLVRGETESSLPWSIWRCGFAYGCAWTPLWKPCGPPCCPFEKTCLSDSRRRTVGSCFSDHLLQICLNKLLRLISFAAADLFVLVVVSKDDRRREVGQQAARVARPSLLLRYYTFVPEEKEQKNESGGRGKVFFFPILINDI